MGFDNCHRAVHRASRLCVAVLALAWLWVSPAAQAQGARLMLKVLPIKGTSLMQGYTNWIEIENFSWAQAKPVNPPSAGGRQVNTNAPDFSDIQVFKSADKSSSNLLYYCANGLLLSNVSIAVVITASHQSSKSDTYCQLDLKNVHISALSESLDASGGQPTETVTFHFNDKMAWTVSQFTTNGTLGGPLVFQANYISAYDKLTKRASALVPFTVSSLQSGAGGLTTITWPAVPGAVYNILRSTSLTGTFSSYATVSNSAVATNMTYTVTNSGNTRFFYSLTGRF